MASFSFRAGNAAKLLRAPLYALGRLVTLLVPRGERWVFGCGAGIGDGPLEVWRVAQEDGVAAVWLVTDDAEAREAAAIGIPTIRRDSWRGFWATVRARVVVVAFGLGDVNPYGASGAFVVQLWHGIPLKRIGMDSSETTRSPVPFARSLVSALLAFAYARSARRIDLMPASHHLIRGRLESAFELPHGRVLVTGEPRVDPLSTGDAHARRRTGRGATSPTRVGGSAMTRRLVLYAPDLARRRGGPRSAIAGAVGGDPWRDRAARCRDAGPLASPRRRRVRSAVPHRPGSAIWAPSDCATSRRRSRASTRS